MTVSWQQVRAEPGLTPERAHPAGEVRTAERATEARATEARATGYRLAELRKSVGVTQVELARLMGIGQPRVSAIERGDIGSLTVASVRGYVEALGGDVRLVARINNDDVALRVPTGGV